MVTGFESSHIPSLQPVFQAMVKVPPKSSKWVDINRDIRMAQTIEPQLPFGGGEDLAVALDGAFVPKIRANLKRNDAAAAVRRRPSLVATATKTRP